MPDRAMPMTAATGLVLPSLLLAGLLVVIGAQTGAIHLPAFGIRSASGPETVTIAPRPYSYRASGEFLSGRDIIDAPLLQVDAPAPLTIMKYQVSAADYEHCVADGACKKADPRRRGVGDVPATGVSYDDATDYAAWLSARSGEAWRLPTIAEWTFAAGSKAVDVALGETDAGDPAARWLAFYEREAELGANALANPEPLGSLGVNEFGVADLAGPVWDWTASCDSRTALDANGSPITHLDSCGAHVLEGRHRSTMTNFVRDAVAGGCSSGTPPDNLGFRLVRDRGWLAALLDNVAALIGRA